LENAEQSNGERNFVASEEYAGRSNCSRARERPRTRRLVRLNGTVWPPPNVA